jgi:hypothetical protein
MFEPCLTFDEKGYYLAAVPDDFAKEMGIKTSYQLVAARLLGFSYPDYLRYARSKGATLKGREGFGLTIFEKLSDCNAFCKELNAEWEKFKKAVKEG